MNRTAAWRGTVGPVGLPRVLLLVLLTLGVAGMHTFGHAEGGHHEPFPPGGGTHSAPPGWLIEHAAAAALLGWPTEHAEAAAADPLSAALPGTPNPGGGLELDVFSVCLAVLGALGLTVWVALTRVRSSRDRHLARLRSAARHLGRAPPTASVRLRLVAVSVLRI